MAGAAGGVDDTEGEERGGVRFMGIDEGVESGFDLFIDEGGRCVVAAGGFAVVACGVDEGEGLGFDGIVWDEFEDAFVDGAEFFCAHIAIVDGEEFMAGVDIAEGAHGVDECGV